MSLPTAIAMLLNLVIKPMVRVWTKVIPDRKRLIAGQLVVMALGHNIDVDWCTQCALPPQSCEQCLMQGSRGGYLAWFVGHPGHESSSFYDRHAAQQGRHDDSDPAAVCARILRPESPESPQHHGAV